MAYRRARKSIRSFRRRPKSGLRRKRLVKLIRSVAVKTAEPKIKNNNIGKTELFHNIVVAQPINGSSYMPTQGVGDNQRVGDQIVLSGFKLRLLFGQKGDRPNVNFRWWVVKVPKGSTYSYALWFNNVTGNVLLDDMNEDFVKVIKTGVMRPNEAGLAATGNDEFTFTKRLFIPYKKVIKFGPSDGVATHNDDDIYFIITCYDAFGSLNTDNVAYYLAACNLHYRDP